MMCNYWEDTFIQYGLMLVHLSGLIQLYTWPYFEFDLYIIL